MGKMTECHLRAALVVTAWQTLLAEKAAERSPRSLRDVMNGRCGQALERPGFRYAKCALDREPQFSGCDLAAVAETLRTRRGGTAPLAWSLAFSNQMALNSALTVRPLALNVALGLIACPLMKVYGGGAKRRHPTLPGLGGVLRP
jgi:hypothetical protein